MKKTGTIEALNLSPKGNYDGFLLRTGKRLVQVNLHKERPKSFDQGLKTGEEISVVVEPEEPRGKPAHVVFRLVRVVSADGFPAEDGKIERHEFSGRVERLNYALHGEVNGGLLESGDFLHLKPKGALTLKLKVGMEVKGHGATQPMVGGHMVIEAEEVNGVAIRAHAAPKKHAAKH